MKKIGLLSLITMSCVFCTTELSAQGPFASLNFGFAMPSASENISYLPFYNSDNSGNNDIEEQIDVSLGKGMNVGIAFGYMFNPNVGVDLGISYFKGSTWEAADRYDGGRTDYTLAATMLRFNPSLIISAGTEGISPYAKMGFIVGSGSVMYTTHDQDGSDVNHEKLDLYGGVAAGFTAAAGATFSFKDKMSFFSELSLISMSYAPEKGRYTEVTDNGADQLPGMETREKQFIFEKNHNYNQNSSPSEPSKQPSFRLPFGSIGINIGLRIAL